MGVRCEVGQGRWEDGKMGLWTVLGGGCQDFGILARKIITPHVLNSRCLLLECDGFRKGPVHCYDQ